MSSPDDTKGDPRIVINGKEYPIPDTFTMGERADMEKITGQDYDPSLGGYRGTLALMYVSIKRVNPNIELDDLRVLTEDDIDIKGVERPQPLGAPSESDESAPTSTESSPSGSDEDPEPTPVPIGTESLEPSDT